METETSKSSRWIFSTVAIGILFSQILLAQKNTPPQRQSLSFENELIEGSAQKPELFYLFQKKNFNYKKLIRMRDNFLPEMRQTSEDLQRRGAG